MVGGFIACKAREDRCEEFVFDRAMSRERARRAETEAKCGDSGTCKREDGVDFTKGA
jgi:hypothetical protein